MITPIEIAPTAGVSAVKIITVPHMGRKQCVFKLTDAAGATVDLRTEVPNAPASVPDFSPQRAAVGTNVSIRLKAKDGDLYGASAFDISGSILPDTGYVEFLLTSAETGTCGLYEASIGRFVGSQLIDTWPVYICVEANAFNEISGTGPLTVPEVRLALLDTYGGTNSSSTISNLLDDVEFSDADIIAAQRWIVMKWNETPPIINQYSIKDFPYRYWWLIGVCGHLLQTSAHRYRRNHLAYSAGGVSIDDQNKFKDYEATGMQKQQEFNEWMMKTKIALNMDYCYGIGL